MARIDGREGIIVAGGSSDGFPVMTSVEFFDLENSQWLDMGTLRQGRLFPGLTTIGNHLYVLGGEAFDDHGHRSVFDSMEALLGNQWVPLREKLPEKRSRFGLIRMPPDFF